MQLHLSESLLEQICGLMDLRGGQAGREESPNVHKASLAGEVSRLIDGMGTEERRGISSLFWLGRGNYLLFQDAYNNAIKFDDEDTPSRYLVRAKLADYLRNGRRIAAEQGIRLAEDSRPR